MKNKSTVIGGIIAAAIVVVGLAVLMGGSNKNANTVNMPEDSAPSTQSHSQNSEASSKNNEPVATTTVKIANFSFSPETIKVKVGDTVTWTNEDAARHDVVADEESMDAPASELLAKGESYSFTFKKAGTYAYHCTPHPYMKAKVIVE